MSESSDQYLEKYKAAIGQLDLLENDVIVLINSQKELKHKDIPPITYLDILIEELPANVTLVLQTFNWNFFKGKKYNYKRTVAQTGLLSELFRRMDGVCRSHHPVYSFAARGPRAQEICGQTSETCWGNGSTLDALSNMNALWVNLGKPFPWGIELLHRTEEVKKVPYRFYKEFKGTVDFGTGEHDYATKFFARPLETNFLYNWDCAVDLMIQRNQVQRYGEEFPLTAVRSADLESACYECLDANILCFLNEPEAFEAALKNGIRWE